jgi:hypothetical protein
MLLDDIMSNCRRAGFILFILLVVANVTMAQFGFLPFEDESGFKGRWDLKVEVPRFLNAYMQAKYNCVSVSPVVILDYASTDSAIMNRLDDAEIWGRIGRQFDVRYVVSGAIQAFSVNRFNAGLPELGGWESFAGDVAFEFSVFDLTLSQKVCSDAAFGEFSDKGLGLTLLGKPSDRKSEFYSLDLLKFGSEEFVKTVIGESMLKSAEDFSGKCEHFLPFLKSMREKVSADSLLTAYARSGRGIGSVRDTAIAIQRRLVKGTILILESDGVFVNVGSEDGLKLGDHLVVYRQGKELRDPNSNQLLGYTDEGIGELVILEMRGPHLSLCSIVAGRGKIEEKDMIKIMVIR